MCGGWAVHGAANWHTYPLPFSPPYCAFTLLSALLRPLPFSPPYSALYPSLRPTPPFTLLSVSPPCDQAADLSALVKEEISLIETSGLALDDDDDEEDEEVCA